jgi:hypothetical protein
MAPSVCRALDAIAKYALPPELIDKAIIAAINVTVCLASSGDARAAEGFNNDILINGLGFSSAVGGRG